MPSNSSASKQLKEYFAGRRKKFTVKVALEGTAFQTKVWRQLQKIPYGQTITYQELARRVGRPKAARAVGQACGANRFPIIIPCHRVVGKKGLGGYAGGLKRKRYLLALEAGKISL